METITLSAIVGEDRRLVIDLPADTPTGPVELTIRPSTLSQTALDREQARAKLLQAGLLVTYLHAPKDAVPLSPEEILRLGTLPPGARPSEELIDEDRGDY